MITHKCGESVSFLYFSAVGLFSAGKGGGKSTKCLKYDPFFNWYTCTCSYEECQRLRGGEAPDKVSMVHNFALGIAVIVLIILVLMMIVLCCGMRGL